MEDDLQIFKVDYLSNHLLHPTKNCNSNLDYQKLNLQILEMKTTSNNLKISKGEYLSNHCMDRDLWVMGKKYVIVLFHVSGHLEEFGGVSFFKREINNFGGKGEGLDPPSSCRKFHRFFFYFFLTHSLITIPAFKLEYT